MLEVLLLLLVGRCGGRDWSRDWRSCSGSDEFPKAAFVIFIILVVIFALAWIESRGDA